MKVLALESSCDETAVAIISNGKALVNLVASQHTIHARFGGVVPELASRRHVEVITSLLQEAFFQTGLTIDDIEGIAATYGPGLMGALLVGLSTAKGIALAKNIPFIGVHHIEGHINAILLEQESIPYPHVALVVSGGHTSLYQVKSFGDYRLVGATRDDAAGEAFDKVAKLLHLDFPGGPAIDRISTQGNPKTYRFPHPKFDDPHSSEFSFSGIKTAVMLLARTLNLSDPHVVANLAASFQQTVITILTEQLFKTAKETRAQAIVISGGVASNRLLRQEAMKKAESIGIPCFLPSPDFCTDNAAMIGYVGEQYLRRGERSPLTLSACASIEVGTV